MEGEHSTKRGLSDRFVDFLFSNDLKKHLLWIVPLGFLLRVLMANSITPLGDEMIHAPRAIGFLHSGLLSTILQAPVWLYLTDIVYSLMGVSLLSSRFLSVFFGSLTIIMIYLLAVKIFNKKVAVISSLSLAMSFFTIRYSLAEMDLAATFFLVVALYSLIIDSEKKKYPYLSAICIGIAALIKTLSLFFVPAFFVAILFYNGGLKKKLLWANTKKIILFGLIILAIYSPILIHNYLWYQDKGMVDTYFAQYFFPSLRENYAGQLGYSNDVAHFLPKFFQGVHSVSSEIFKLDPLIISLGIIGLLLSFMINKDKRNYWWILVAYFFSGFILLILSNWLQTHYTTLMPVLAIFCGYALVFIGEKIGLLINKKRVLTIIVLALIISQLFMLWPYVTSRGGLSGLRSYASDSIDKNSIVVVDSRVYRGRVAWAFNDFHYLEASLFPQLMQLNQNLSGGQKVPTKIYFVECAIDDCGWGTVGAGELNDSSEALVSLFASQGKLEKSITGGYNAEERPGQVIFKVYSAVVDMDPRIILSVDSTHTWFYYPMNYIPKEQIYDNYEVNGLFNSLLYGSAWVILIASIIASMVLIAYPFYHVYRSD
ncbi:MAG: glycosyltransferase family 39 protein [Nanoarchaeota archaeon]